jgi:hypothetical protein
MSGDVGKSCVKRQSPVALNASGVMRQFEMHPLVTCFLAGSKLICIFVDRKFRQ